MLNSFEEIYRELPDDVLKQYFLQEIIIFDEIKLKMCERFLTSERSNCEFLQDNISKTRVENFNTIILMNFASYFVS